MTITDDQIKTIARTMHGIRGWAENRTLPVLRDSRVSSRPHLIVHAAAAFVAIDPASDSPTRLLANGPWWDAAYRAFNSADDRPAGPAYRPFVPDRDKPAPASPEVIAAARAKVDAAVAQARETQATRAQQRAERRERTEA